MKTTRTIRAQFKHRPGQQKLFNLTGPDPAAKDVADSAREWAATREKTAFATPWSTHYQQQALRGVDPTDMAVRDQALQHMVRQGGPRDAQRSGLGHWWDQVHSPGRSHSATPQAHGQAMSHMAQQYEQMGLNPEEAMLRAQRALGPQGEMREGLVDHIYQHGTPWQRLFTPGEDTLQARARSRVRGGQGGPWMGGGIRGLFGDYFGGQQREQAVASQDAQRNWQAQHDAHKRHMGRQVPRQHGAIQDMEAARDNRSLKFASTPMAALQQQQMTADWRRHPGLGGAVPFLGARTGQQSEWASDLHRAQHGSWWDGDWRTALVGGLVGSKIGGPLGGIVGGIGAAASRPRVLASRAGHWLTGRERTGHGQLMRENEAYRQAVEGLGKGYREGMDLTGLIAGSRGRAGGWYDPRSWFTDRGLVGRREGVDFQSQLGGDIGYQEAMARMATGQMSHEQAERVMAGLGNVPEAQRKAMGMDKAFDRSFDPRQRGLASGWMNLSDQLGRGKTEEERAGMFAEPRPRPETRSPSVPEHPVQQEADSGSIGKDARGSTTKLSAHNWAAQATRTPSPYNPINRLTPHNMQPTGTNFDTSDSARRVTGLRETQSAHQRWDPNKAYQAQMTMAQRTGANPYRAHTFNPYDDRSVPRGVVRRLGGRIGRFFMTEDAIRRRDPYAQQTAQQIAAGEWEPGMSIEHAATGTGGHFAPTARIGQWLGISQSPEQHAAQLRQQAVQSPQFKALEQQYARGELSPEQFQRASGGALGQMYASDPTRFAEKARGAETSRRGLALDSMRAQAAQHRRKALGPQSEAMYAI